MQLEKSKVGTWLLISLLPTGAAGIVAFVGFGVSGDPLSPDIEGGWEAFWLGATLLLWAYWWMALLAGVVLKIWGGFERRHLYREARQYAELHGWQQISDTAWTNFKRGDAVLRVNQAYGKLTYILSIELNSHTEATDGFSRSVYALQFGDFLWQNVLQVRSQVDADVVQQTRGEWDRMRALAPGR